MYAVIRTYSGSGAAELFDLLAGRGDEIKTLVQDVSGFVSYSLIRTADGGASVTVCQDKTGADESMQMAREWIQTNAPELGVSPPAVTEGEIALHLP